MSVTANPSAPAALPRREVPLLDLKVQYRQFKAEILPVLERICESQYFILGPETVALEAAIARYCFAAYGIGVSSGTDALLLALMGLDIGPGDEVITSPYTFFATGGTIARTGARPIWVDIDPATFNLSPAAVQRFIDAECVAGSDGLIRRSTGGRVRALMPVHLYGQCADMRPLLEIAGRHGLRVIEDAAQAIGAEYAGGARAGSLGDVGCFSFFPSKNLGAFGDAGLCTAQDAELAEKLRVLRVHGGKPKYYHAMIGGNFRIDELQSAVLNVKLRYLDGWTEGRQRNAATYRELFTAAGLSSTVTLPHAVPGYRHIYNQFVIRAPERDRLKQHLTDHGVGTEIYYPVPLHVQQCFAYLGGKAGDCPESERAARETLALPIYAELERGQLEYVVDVIRRFYA
jgi:dTDP-4-amino-4,6-dideoxygalactose transaminase